MAKTTGVWGIDIGQCAVKALRCRVEGDRLVADAFDFIEYPKILSQPESNPTELVAEALQTLLSRNDLRGDKVAVSVPGQSGLARYFKPPPVDAKKIAEIVKFEAKQQIPFPLPDVIWDYQRMGGGTEVDGVALETEIGLFAMKRDQVYKALQPFLTTGIEVDFIQLAPLAIYNYVVYDRLEATIPPPEEFDANKPPPSTVVISMGTDTTDLVVTNGYRVWQRNIPLGGNHFTRQLTKELKLTFAKAEHLKRNAHSAEDPRVIFQAMRPIFNDMVTEIQRSLNFFQSLDKKATIQNVLILGNTIKLPGLKQYLTKHLGYDVIDAEDFTRLEGEAVIEAPTFKDNVLAFGTCYGLCLQASGKSSLATNLLPPEIVTDRLIRAKKPWAVAAAGAFLLACTFNYLFHFAAWNNVHIDSWDEGIKAVGSVNGASVKFKTDDEAKQKELTQLLSLGDQVVGNAERRVLWLELLKAINDNLPRTENRKDGEILDYKKVWFEDQRELHIEQIESQYFADLKMWYDSQGGQVQARYAKFLSDLAAANPAPAPGVVDPAQVPPGAPGQVNPAAPQQPGQIISGQAAPPGVPQQPGVPGMNPAPGMPGAPGAAGPAAPPGPQGPGWVIELRGYHYFNKIPLQAGGNHVRNTIMKELHQGSVSLPLDSRNQKFERFTLKELGIGYPLFVADTIIQPREVPNPNYQDQKGGGGFGGPGGREGGGGPVPAGPSGDKDKSKDDEPAYWNVQRYDFTIQFAWQETPLGLRLEERRVPGTIKRGQPSASGGTSTFAPAAAQPAFPIAAPAAAPVVPTGEGDAPPQGEGEPIN